MVYHFGIPHTKSGTDTMTNSKNKRREIFTCFLKNKDACECFSVCNSGPLKGFNYRPPKKWLYSTLLLHYCSKYIILNENFFSIKRIQNLFMHSWNDIFILYIFKVWLITKTVIVQVHNQVVSEMELYICFLQLPFFFN